MRTNLPCPQHSIDSAAPTGRRGARVRASAGPPPTTPPLRLSPDGRIAARTGSGQALPWSVLRGPDSEEPHIWLADEAVADWTPLTPATVDRSRLGRTNRRRGHEAERAVARWLRHHGFPGAERSVRTGYTTGERQVADPGDLTGTPGIVWQIKDTARESLTEWLRELDEQTTAARADLGLLVHRRRGAADPGRWWAWLRVTDLGPLLGVTGRHHRNYRHPVRMELAHAVELLRAAGYGDPAKVNA